MLWGGRSKTLTGDHLFHVLSFNKYYLSIFYVPGTKLGSGGHKARDSAFKEHTPMGDKAVRLY